ncbi:hypothetical protein [Pyrodictium abyssi]|uniref:Uncharacterized protein n=1 Tax=Pyrodictium abyssi TaxID=54256 RepID=A0ABM8IYF1_9CREN|nr:hypothetical protein PABY_21240 [Pyrodictium abyssi]
MEAPRDWVLCTIFFQGEKALEMCNKVLAELAEKGYIEIRRNDPERGMKYHVVKRLRQIGLLMKKTTVTCDAEQPRRIYVYDRKRAARLRLEFDQLDRPWPICIE